MFATLAFRVRSRLCSSSYIGLDDFIASICLRVFPYLSQTFLIFLLRSSFFCNHVLNCTSSISSFLMGLYIDESISILWFFQFACSEISIIQIQGVSRKVNSGKNYGVLSSSWTGDSKNSRKFLPYLNLEFFRSA